MNRKQMVGEGKKKKKGAREEYLLLIVPVTLSAG